MKPLIFLMMITIFSLSSCSSAKIKPMRWSYNCKGNSWIIQAKKLPDSFYDAKKDLCLRKTGVLIRRRDSYSVSNVKKGKCESKTIKPDLSKKMGLYIRCEDY